MNLRKFAHPLGYLIGWTSVHLEDMVFDAGHIANRFPRPLKYLSNKQVASAAVAGAGGLLLSTLTKQCGAGSHVARIAGASAASPLILLSAQELLARGYLNMVAVDLKHAAHANRPTHMYEPDDVDSDLLQEED